MKLTKNQYNLREMWAVVGKAGGINALYPNKWQAEKSERYVGYKDKTVKRVQVLISEDEVSSNTKVLGNTSQDVTQKEIMLSMLGLIREIYDLLFSNKITTTDYTMKQFNECLIIKNRIRNLLNE